MSDAQLNKRHEARSAAVQALYQWQHNPDSADAIIAQFMVDHDMEHVSMDYFTSCVRGVINNIDQIDEWIKPYLDRSIHSLDPVELATLRLAAFELSEKFDVPYRVVLNEATELAKKFGAQDGYKYINAILDKLADQLREAEKKNVKGQ